MPYHLVRFQCGVLSMRHLTIPNLRETKYHKGFLFLLRPYSHLFCSIHTYCLLSLHSETLPELKKDMGDIIIHPATADEILELVGFITEARAEMFPFLN